MVNQDFEMIMTLSADDFQFPTGVDLKGAASFLNSFSNDEK